MNAQEVKALEEAIDQMYEIAHRFGLDYFDMRFELVPSDVLYTFGAYAGMPTRFSHWSFGKSYHRMKMDYDFGLSRIYELVINSNPCYAFLLDSNSLVQNKLVSAHVLGHCDFFKNNAMFAHTPRNIVDSMAASAERFRSYEAEHGKQAVEEFLDAGLAIQEHIDPSHAATRRPQGEGWEWGEGRQSEGKGSSGRAGGVRGMRTGHVGAPSSEASAGRYADLFALDSRLIGGNVGIGTVGATSSAKPNAKSEPTLEKDLLLYLIHNSKVLAEWQRDMLTVIREEMRYFWPQIETKIMNEGWATYWHLRIMRELDLTDAEALDFAQTHSGVVLPSRTSINPYLLGVKMWEDIERRYDNPTDEGRKRFGREPGQGRAQMFEVREMDSDSSFIRSYLTKELVEDLDMYLYQKVGNEWRVVEQDWEKVRDKICAARVNGGYPVLYVKDGDYLFAGELYLWHSYEGVELDPKYTEKTLPHVHTLWGRTVHLETVLEGRPVLFTHDGKKTSRKFL